MRALTLLLFLSACSTQAPPAPDTEGLSKALRAWRASPGADTLTAVSEQAGTLSAHPIGDAAVDRALGEALCGPLLRPDLGKERLQPHAATLTGSDAGPWLDCLLRSGDLPAFAEEVRRVHGRIVDVEVEALEAASVQARSHAGITWREAMVAHDAGALADAQHPRGRALDRPVPDLAASFRVLGWMFPGQQVHAVVTRSANATEDDPLVDAGVIPVVGGHRRVFGYAHTPEALDALANRVRAEKLTRLVGVALETRDAEGRTGVRLCAEGHMRGDQLWLLTACDNDAELAWLQATERFLDLQVGGATETKAGNQVRQEFADKLTGAR